MKTTCKLLYMGCYLMLCFGLQSAQAAYPPIQYRFKNMMPISQIWDFNSPSSIAVAPDGSVWVADNGQYTVDERLQGRYINKRIQHVGADGSLISQFELDDEGDSLIGNAHTSDDVGTIALAPDGSVWVTRVGHARIQHYSVVGKPIKTFGSKGSTPGQFNYPHDLAVTGDGSIWVADTQGRLQHFTADGDFIAEIKTNGCAVDPADANCGNLYITTKAIATAADGGIWVLGDHHLLHYTADGQVIAVVGGLGKSPGQFSSPNDLGVEGDGSVWVADTQNLRLQHFNVDGSFITQIKTGSYNIASPLHLSIATDGSVWLIAGDESGSSRRIQHFNANGGVVAQFGFGLEAGQLYSPSNVAVAANDSVWVTDPINHRLQNFDSDGGFVTQVSTGNGFSYSDEGTPFYSPIDNSVWVTGKHYLKHLEINGNVINSFPVTSPLISSGFGEGSDSAYIADIAFASDGSLWLLNIITTGPVASFRSEVQHLGADGHVIDRFEVGFRSNIKVIAPNLKIAGESLWVGGQEGYLWHLNTDGGVIAKIKGSGFLAPVADGGIWFADTVNNRIQRFAADGGLMAQLGSLGGAPGQFKAPTGISVASDGSVWVADSDNNRIQKFTPTTLQDMPAEYDDKNGLLYLDDVAAGGLHYQATLQLQNGVYRLLTLMPALAAYRPAASFNEAANLIEIPLARAFGLNYQAQFEYLGNSLFQLQAAKPK